MRVIKAEVVGSIKMPRLRLPKLFLGKEVPLLHDSGVFSSYGVLRRPVLRPVESISEERSFPPESAELMASL